MAISSTFVAADGGGYELQMGRWSHRLAPKFIEFAGIKVADRVLDVGCGTGNLTANLALNPDIRGIYGIDLSASYIEHAKGKNTGSGFQFQVGDACALPFGDQEFDHSLSMLVLQFVPQPEMAINEMRRVTRSGGTVAAAVWDSRGGVIWSRMFWDTAAMLDPEAGIRRAKSFVRPVALPGGLERAWKTAGFTEVVEDMLTIRMDFTSFEDYWAPMEGKDGPVADYVSALAPDRKELLRDKVRLAYVDGESDGPRSYAAIAWAVKGKVPN
jgi:SAM-dependent methyltransferase